MERERRDGSRFTFAYQRPWKDGFREKCVATLRNSSYKGETYFSPDVWKAFDLAFPSLSLSLSSRRSSLSKGRISLSGSVYISKGTDSWRCRPSYLLLFSEQLVSSVDPTSQIDPCRDIRASGNADIKMARAIEKYDSFSLSLSPFHETLLFSTRTRKLLFIERSNNGRGIISRLLLRDSSTPPLNCSRNSVELESFSIRVQ